jgi:integrase
LRAVASPLEPTRPTPPAHSVKKNNRRPGQTLGHDSPDRRPESPSTRRSRPRGSAGGGGRVGELGRDAAGRGSRARRWQREWLTGSPDVCCHSFRATGITAYLNNGCTLENAQTMAAHKSPRTTKLYDRTKDEITLDEVERIAI